MDHENAICYNCHRHQSTILLETHHEIYHLQFHEYNSTQLKKYRSFKLCRINYNDENEINIFCKECSIHLSSDNKNHANKPTHTWPSFIWYILNDKEFRQCYGPQHLWKFVPKVWRYWWLDSYNDTIRQLDQKVDIDFPTPLFVDRTEDICEWNELISSFTLPNLRKACNKYLLPTILCPFGCSSFLHRHGQVSLDMLLQRYLPRCILKRQYSNKNSFKYFESMREDFIRDNDDDYDSWLFNPEWTVRPTITIIEGVPVIMTCDDHNKGTRSYIIHPARSPLNHILPSTYSDQIAHCSIRTRTIKPMCRKYYSNSFQMHEQRGSFNGIDTCNISTFRQFNFHSTLLSDFEASSILNRPDINALLGQLVNENAMSKSTAKGKRDYAKNKFNDYDFDKFAMGATYVPFDAAMSMQKELTNNSIIVTIDKR